MKKSIKKLLCSLLVVVIFLTSAPLQAFVDADWSWIDFGMRVSALAETGQCGDDVYWTYNSSTKQLVINGKGAMKVSGRSPFYSSDIKYVVISDGITSIDNNMFAYCENLITVSIPNSVTTIGDSAFVHCESLVNATLPNNLSRIYGSAFFNCFSLKNVVIPDTVVSIGDLAFYGCNSLLNINIPQAVTNIGDGAFRNCLSLENIKVEKGNDNYSSDSYGVLFNKSKTALYQYPVGKSNTTYNIPSGVTSIYEAAFANCKKLSIITIPDTVTSIGSAAFSGTAYYTNTSNWVDGVLYIGKHLVASKSGVPENLKVKNGTISIAGKTFWSCYSLKSVTLPDSLVTIGESAFAICKYLTNVTFGNGLKTIGDSAFSCCYGLYEITIPNCVINIGAGAFGSCEKLSNITIPNSVTYIANSTFSSCKNLRSIIIPDSVISIGESAFSSCSNLANITIPDGVTEIKNGTFWLCEKLKNIVIPKSVKSIGAHAFGGCKELTDVYYKGTEQEWNSIDIDYVTSGESYYADRNAYLKSAKKHYNYIPPQDSYFTVSSDTYSVDSIYCKDTATYKIHLLDENSDFLSVNGVTVQNNTTDIVNISTNKVSDTEIELTVEPIKDGEASISLFNGDNSNPQYYNFTVYSNTTTYRADQVPVTNEKLKTNFSRGDLTVDNFEYIFDENKGKYVATMDVYNSSGAIGVVAAYTQDGLISDIEQVDPYVPLPGDFGDFLVYLGTGAVSILKGENWNYRYSGYCQKTSIEIEVPEDGYLTVSCDVTSDNAAFIYNLVSIGVDFAFKTAEVIDVLGTDTDKLAKDTTKTLAKKVSEYFNEDSEWTKGAIKKLAKKLSKQFNMAYLEEISVLSLEMLDEMYKNVGEDFSDAVLDVIIDLTKEEIKEFGVMAAAKKLIKDKVIGVAEETLLKAASIMFDGGSYVNLINSILGAYRYNVGTGKTMVVFKPKGEDGFICKDTIKVKSDIITDEVLLHTYIIKDTQKEDAFVRKTIYSDFNRGDGLRKEELSIDLNRIVEIHEISLWKNGQEVFDTFTATVEMNLPSYIDRKTCSIYRVEKDGTYTKLDTRIEGNKIIFETNHFSEYILTGVIEDLQETTPCDEHVYDEVKVEPTCIEAGSITYTCYCGDTYIETIEANGHTESEWKIDSYSTCSTEGSKHIECTVCKETIKTEVISKLGHNFSKDFTVDKKASFTEAGSKSKHCLRNGCTTKSEVTVIPKLVAEFTDSDMAVLAGNAIVMVPGLTVEQLLSLATEGSVVKKENGDVAESSEVPATGMVLELPDGTEHTIVVLGDVDGDGGISAADARLALRASVGLENYTADSVQTKAAKVSNGDSLSAADARLIIRASVGLEDPKSWMK